MKTFISPLALRPSESRQSSTQTSWSRLEEGDSSQREFSSVFPRDLVARILELTRGVSQRTFLKTGPTNRNIPIQAIGLSLYEELGLPDGSGLAQEEKIGKEVVRTQWLDFSTLGSTPLVGRRILIVVSLEMFPTRLRDVRIDSVL
jgi:hypothetical protein